MSAVKHEDTAPEISVRKAAHALGYRFRLHRRDLPGKPDIVFPSRRAVILVHGCFWHQHPGCPKARLPATRTEFWSAKLGRNVERDREVVGRLQELGWRVLTVWECETKNVPALVGRLVEFLGPPRR